VLDEYLENGRSDMATFRDLAGTLGGRHVRRRGVDVVLREGRVIAAAALTRQIRKHVEPAPVPCATCGALPVGTFGSGDPEGDRRYDCGPHDPVWPGVAEETAPSDVQGKPIAMFACIDRRPLVAGCARWETMPHPRTRPQIS
jgi:hypothetical protein